MKLGLSYTDYGDDEDQLLMNLHKNNFTTNYSSLDQTDGILIHYSNLTIVENFDQEHGFLYDDFNTGSSVTRYGFKQLVEYTLFNADPLTLGRLVQDGYP